MNPMNDPWVRSRVIWMRDQQPDHLRNLVRQPEALRASLDQAVQAARRVQHRAAKAGVVAEELALAELCPVTNPPENQLPISDREWEKMQGTLKSAGVEM